MVTEPNCINGNSHHNDSNNNLIVTRNTNTITNKLTELIVKARTASNKYNNHSSTMNNNSIAINDSYP